MRVFLILAALAAGTAWARGDYQVISRGSWNGEIPSPQGPVVFTLVTPRGEYPLDEAALRRLTWVRLKTRYHPDERKDIEAVFEGVLLAQLLEEAGYPNPRRIRFEALDGYQISVEWSLISRFEPMIALYRDGRPLDSFFGPARVVFPYHRLRPDPVAYNSYWVWKLKRIVVLP